MLCGVNLGRFTPDRGSGYVQAEGREFLLESHFLQRYVADRYGKYKYTTTILPGIFSYLSSYARERGRSLLHGQFAQYGQHRYNKLSAHTVKQKQHMVKEWNTQHYPRFERNLGFHLAMLEEMLIRARQRGVKVVLLELPHEPCPGR